MAYEMRDMSGSLFRNDKKEKDTHPDHRGSVMVEGVEYWLDGWINQTQAGKKYFGLKLKRKDAQPSTATSTPAPAPSDLDDDVPF